MVTRLLPHVPQQISPLRSPFGRRFNQNWLVLSACDWADFGQSCETFTASIPQFLWNNSEFGYLLLDYLRFGVRSRDPLTGHRIAQKALAVPYHHPRVEFVAQYAGSAFAVPTDCCVAPMPAVGTRLVLAVECPRNCLRGTDQRQTFRKCVPRCEPHADRLSDHRAKLRRRGRTPV